MNEGFPLRRRSHISRRTADSARGCLGVRVAVTCADRSGLATPGPHGPMSGRILAFERDTSKRGGFWTACLKGFPAIRWNSSPPFAGSWLARPFCSICSINFPGSMRIG